MDRKIWKRFLSLTVALEMFLSPLPTAWAASSLADGTETAETPAVVEAQRAETPDVSAGESDRAPAASGEESDRAPAASTGGSAGAAVGSGRSSAGTDERDGEAELLSRVETNYMADVSFGVPLNNNNYPKRYGDDVNAYFTWESSTKNWGYRVSDGSESGSKWFIGDTAYSGWNYVILPRVGRLPDLEFDGFYVLDDSNTADWWEDADQKTVKSWVFDESWTDSAVKLEKTTDAVIFKRADDSADYTDWKAENADVYKISDSDMTALEGSGIIREDMDAGSYRVPIVGRWMPSGKNQLTGLTATLQDEDGGSQALSSFYTEKPTGNPTAGTLELSQIDRSFYTDNPDAPKEFWLRVEEDQAFLTLEWEAFEPYYDYTVKGEGACPVSLRAEFNGREVTRSDGAAVTAQMGWTDGTAAAFPPPDEPDGLYTTYQKPNNSADLPARSRWSAVDIPLAKVSEATDMDHPDTTITITVDAPDGTSASYILHVERLVTPAATLGLGNTPVAMIEKDRTGNWGSTDEEKREKKDEAKNYFKSQYKLGSPTGPADYTYYKGIYYTNAWDGLVWEGKTNAGVGGSAYYNIDLDETAVVAYQDSAFADPGVTFRGSDGRTVAFGDDAQGDYQNCVKRTIQLKTADTLHAGLYGDADAGTDRWYTVDETGKAVLSETPAAQTLRKADGSDGVDLRGQKVLPGVYTMEYTYTDPQNPDVSLTALRPLVILPTPGDVDMDGAVTAHDALAIGLYRSAWDSASAADVSLLQYRVLGTKTDTDILNGFQPVLANLGSTDYFYPPLPVPEDADGTYTRKTWSQVRSEPTTGAGRATLELRYLGLERGTLQYIDGAAAHTNADSQGRTGPWQADGEGKVSLAKTGADGSRALGYQSDVFWLGVYLTAGDLAGQGVEDLTLTLVYDSSFVQPAVVYGYEQFQDAENQEDRWYSALFYHNLGTTGSKLDGVGQTLFSGFNGTDYSYHDGTSWGRPYATHYSKVIGELETLQQDTSGLREMVFRLRHVTSPTVGNLARLPEDGTQAVCVLAVPFQLVKHPTGARVNSVDGEDRARLVELGAGMRDFNLVTSPAADAPAGVSAASMFARLFSALDGEDAQAQTLSAENTTPYAYSAQTSIYGGGTQNLREEVAYAADETTGVLSGLVPLGVNNTVATELTHADYDTEYQCHVAAGTLTGTLPPGLSYARGVTNLGTISGTPEKAGEFSFTITSVGGVEYYYVLVVNKRELRFKPEKVTSYYGQPEYRGTGQSFAFRYTVDDLADRDIPAGKTRGDLTGAGEELVDILGENYTPPAFTARTSTDSTAPPIGVKTPATAESGTGYPICLDQGTGLDDNYILTLDETEGTPMVLIRRRPVWVDHLTADAETTGAKVYSAGSVLTNHSFTLNETAETGQLIHLAFDPMSVVNGVYNTLPLTGEARVEGDVFTTGLTLSGTFQRNAEDEARFPSSVASNLNKFYLTQNPEIRLIGELELTQNAVEAFKAANPNYDLHYLTSAAGSILHPEDNRVYGSVYRQEVTGLEMTHYPYALQAEGSVTYGGAVPLYDLRIRVTQNNQEASGEYDHISDEYNSDLAKSLNIHYNWVTPEEMELGLREENRGSYIGSGWDPETGDARPYVDTNVNLHVSMSGMYLCAIVPTYADDTAGSGAATYIKCYSAAPITVVPKEVTLTLQDMTRFYGEAGAEPVYQYNANELVNADKIKLQTEYHLTGAADELEWLLEEDASFVKPTVQFSKIPRPLTTESEKAAYAVTVDTDATSTTYYQIISGAKAGDYTFRYDRADGTVGEEYGTANLIISPRPIVAEDIWSMYYAAGEDPTSTFATVYADSKNLLLEHQVDNEAETPTTPFTASGDPKAKNRVTFSAPDYDPETKTVSYYNGGTGYKVDRTGLVYTGAAVLDKDLAELEVTYHVQFLPDQDHASWNTMTDNFYDVDSLEETGGRGQRPVEIRDLALTGTRAHNYTLVYKESFYGQRKAPNSAQLDYAPLPTTSASVDNHAPFLRYGTGLVILRPIKDLVLQSVGQTRYTYGDVYAPQNAGDDGKQMVLSVRYDTRFDNYPAENDNDGKHNIRAETVYYTDDSFAQRGFIIHYIDAAQTAQVVGEGGQILQSGEHLYPNTHDGKHLFVTGRRGASDELVYSAISTQTLTVDRAALTLTARNIHRYYGEKNSAGYVAPEYFDTEQSIAPFTYYFPASQLAQWDREMLSALLDRTIQEVDTLTQAQLETALTKARGGDEAQRAWADGFGYVKPSITTTADELSPVNNRDSSYGEYDVTNTAASFTNYRVTGEGAKLYVYPRPIRIAAVKSSADDPVYTVYNMSAGRVFNTAYDGERVTVARSNLGTDVPVTRSLVGSELPGSLPLTGAGLVGSDALTFKARVEFPEEIVLPDGETDATVSVVVLISRDGLGSSTGEAQKNYVLVADFEDPDAVAAVKLRTIGQIIIESLPKAKYTYGETLDLSGLKVRVIYQMLGDEGQIAEQVNVKYIDPNQFQSYGLYVNYWDTRYDTLPDAADYDAIKALPTAYRKAATGDHVTIAPTHDTQRYLGSDMSKPLERPFAVNGAGLVISAFQAGEDQEPVRPKIVAARKTALPGTGLESYEYTEDNPDAFTFSVTPMRLNYTLSATDKTYNGDTKTAGTLRLTNLFDRDNVQTQAYAAADGSHAFLNTTVTDVVYVPVGAGYEDKGDNYSDYNFTAYQVTDGSIAFTTGAYAYRSTGYMDKNDAVAWAEGYGWDRGLLEFSFPNPNVHYEDETFAAGLPGVGTAALAEYWRASQDRNGVDGRWDSYPNVSQMPVEVRNMTFTGPDAANYTWGPGDEPRKTDTEVTLDSDPAALGRSQAGLPYATIHKANRQPIQDLLAGTDFALPTLEVDVHTNAVRLTYGEELSRVPDRIDPADGSDGAVRNETGAEDYRDELHFEYALAYQDADGLLNQWAGRDGQQGYQDTRFFGGEVYLPEIDPGYIPDLTRLDKIEDANDQTVYKGQHYRWAEEDTGVSDRGWREDAGFSIDPAAYPGYATYGETVRDAYWYYDLYNTDRVGLPRDTVCYPLVRLAETHNFNPSGDLTADGDGDGQPDVSAQALYDARVAAGAYRLDGTETRKTAAEETSQAVFAAAQGLREAARTQAQAQVERDAAIAADTFPDTPPKDPEPAGAVKTYHQRLDLISAGWERNTTGDGEYLVRLVEDVKFTDTLRYLEQRLMDAVVYNNPTRYYAYAWDPDMSAQLRFGDADNPIDLDTVMTFAVRQRQPGGSVVDLTWTYDPQLSNHTAQLYVRLTNGGGQKVRSITIVPSVLFARVGDRPIQLGLVTDPEMPVNRRYTWTSSNPEVASVSETGVVTFRGEGTAVITVTTTNNRSDSILVVVSPALPTGESSTGIPLFNRYYTGAWADLDGDFAFRPKETMTRGDVVRLLDVLLNPEYPLSRSREIAYVDVTGKERYYGALVRLTRAGVVKGVPGSAFAGERLASRAEFVTMVARMLELSVPDTVGMAHAFADAGEDATWAYAYIDAMAKSGVIKGTGGGNFAPDRPITREEAAAVIARLVVVREDMEYKRIPSDVTPENWSYAAVLRAVNTVMTPEL